jgi:dipeptidyl aminopeptidase/acylaminoacyl peptidase
MFRKKQYDERLSALAGMLFVLLILPPNGQAQAPSRAKEPSIQEPGRYFTVRDSIEMVRFGSGGNAVTISPDHKSFVAVTSRGLIQSDEIESTLWVFPSERVREFLRGSEAAQSPLPKMIARVAAISQASSADGYELIRNVRWMPDSKALVFLGQGSDRGLQLYRVGLRAGSVQTLTPEGIDVTQLDVSNSSIVYRATRPEDNSDAGEFINTDARDITGVPLQSILFPELRHHPTYDELWVIRNGKSIQVVDRDNGRPIHLSNHGPRILSISPDGHSVVVWQPSDTVPLSWEDYEPTRSRSKLRSNDVNVTSPSNQLRPGEYAVIDLKSGKSTPLIKAPLGWTFGYSDMTKAIWSADEKKILLTNTYLPLDGADEPERSKRLRPCAAAIVDTASNSSSCVVFSTFASDEKSELTDASFGETSDDVVLSFLYRANGKTEERYHRERGVWQLSNLPLAQQEEVSLQVKQDLNTPPALWATDPQTGASRKIWDPNPQLAQLNLGDVSVFHWKDASGYEWTGGLVKPPDYSPGKRYPLVLQMHGFPEFVFMTDGVSGGAYAARALAAVGIVVLQVRDRLDHAVTGDEASGNILGYESAIDQLASDGLVDPGKVGIVGFSRTCYYVESALIKDPKRFASAVIADGVDESYVQYLLFDTGRSPSEGEQIYGSPPFGDGLKRWIEGAPGFHLDRIQTPLRIMAITPASVLEEWEINASLWRQGKPVDLIYFPHGQHVLQKPLERLAAQQGNVDWFRFWLKGEEDSDPAKAEQYARWREQRKPQTQSQSTTPTN